ncbi:hypothetical protein SAMN06265222_1247 [Neorhodopirellula lusitana]|uniref:Uncharacterized protein n=1 Tax=Neorhodopirellula lusitana TaxID=445327 RepID=A0ABY1QQZ3_9BACT|nr:hypothetical protein SAMN06265222_1247 [Neorhodopirellula lusitana]
MHEGCSAFERINDESYPPTRLKVAGISPQQFVPGINPAPRLSH